MSVDELGTLLRDAVPELADPPDRVAEVLRRARHKTQVKAMLVASAAVVGIAIGAVLLAGPGPHRLAPAGPSSPTAASAQEVPPAQPGLAPAPAVQEAANKLVAFAGNPTREHFDAIPFASDDVQLALGKEVIATVPTEDLADPVKWRLDVEEFAGRVGPFSALTALDSTRDPNVTGGVHDRCAWPATPVPDGLEKPQQVAIQPGGIDSCLDWFAVDLYLDFDDRIVAVRLDYTEP